MQILAHPHNTLPTPLPFSLLQRRRLRGPGRRADGLHGRLPPHMEGRMQLRHPGLRVGATWQLLVEVDLVHRSMQGSDSVRDEWDHRSSGQLQHHRRLRVLDLVLQSQPINDRRGHHRRQGFQILVVPAEQRPLPRRSKSKTRHF